MSTIIHLHPETHRRFKAECKRRGLKMRDVVDHLILDWLAHRDGLTPVEKKPVQRLDETPPPAADPFTLPPFWAGARVPA